MPENCDQGIGLTGSAGGCVGVNVGYAHICLRVEYAERGKAHGILFRLSPFCEWIDLEYVRIHVTYYRIHQAEYTIRILVAAPQEYVNTYSTRRLV